MQEPTKNKPTLDERFKGVIERFDAIDVGARDVADEKVFSIDRIEVRYKDAEQPEVALTKLAEVRNLAPDALLTRLREAARKGPYPTADCLSPEEVAALAARSELDSQRQQHLASCSACTELVRSAIVDRETAAKRVRELLNKSEHDDFHIEGSGAVPA